MYYKCIVHRISNVFDTWCYCHSGQKVYPVVGTKTFESKEDYLKYISKVGQHPIHCTPCLNPERVNWSHPVVYEQWVRHSSKTDSKTGVTRTHYRCRRNKRGGTSGNGQRSSKSTTYADKGHVGCKCVTRHIVVNECIKTVRKHV